LPQAFILGRDFLAGEGAALVLGDNIFYGSDMETRMREASQRERGADIFAYQVKDPERYGVAEFDADGKVISLEEKPSRPKSRFAIVGLYFFDDTVTEKVKALKPSARGELEIVDLMRLYLEVGTLRAEVLGHGFAWLDTGTHEALSEAGTFIEVVQKRQGIMVACPEEIAFKRGWIGVQDIENSIKILENSEYGAYLMELIGRSPAARRS
jgi:glucose-1-phosphate thymidylyltransferase